MEASMKPASASLSATTLLLCLFFNLPAEIHLVGQGKSYTRLQDVTEKLKPGDVVLVDGNATYPSGARFSKSGTANQRIIISGIQPPGGTCPKIAGTTTYGIEITGDYITLDGFEVTGRPKGIGVFGDHIIVRNCIIDSCNHGLVGYGTGTGSVTVEFCEFYGNGVPTGGATQHQIYMATDEKAHPGAIFRLQHCYIHHGVEGDNVKSRSERNEIWYNWIEIAGSSGHGLGLFAPDPEDNEEVSINTAREDADVVGNVIIQSRNACARIGGDTPGQPTNGRYRFVNNTFILTGTRGDAIRTFNTIESLEMYNNAVYATAQGGDIRIINDADGEWAHSPRSLAGGNNWIIAGATMVPSANEWSGTVRGSASPFVNAGAKDFRPAAGGPLVNGGAATTPTIAAYPFHNPLFPPAFHPPLAALIDTGSAQKRPVDAAIDIGAFEASSQSVFNLLPSMHGSGIVDCKAADGSKYKQFYADGRVARTTKRYPAGLRIARVGDEKAKHYAKNHTVKIVNAGP